MFVCVFNSLEKALGVSESGSGGLCVLARSGSGKEKGRKNQSERGDTGYRFSGMIQQVLPERDNNKRCSPLNDAGHCIVVG